MKESSHLHKREEEKDRQSLWKLTYDTFRPAQESLREALCTLGNGYFGTRGAACESAASRIHYPGTYIAGIYNKTPTHIAGRTVYNDDLVNCPNWLFLTFRLGDGDWFDPVTSRLISYRQELDMRRGILMRRIRFCDEKGNRAGMFAQRIVHMEDPHRAAISYTIESENYEGWMTIRSALDGTVQNTGVSRYRGLNTFHLEPLSCGTFGRNGIYLSMKTSESGVEIAEAARLSIFSDKGNVRPEKIVSEEDGKRIFQDYRIFVKPHQRYTIEKIVAIYTSRDKGVRRPRTAAIKSAKKSPRFEELFRSHRRAWYSLWKLFDIQVTGDPFSQRALRLHTFHLLETASPHNRNIDAGLPARGLHGEAYRGHVFWDELYVMPFFITRSPEIAKALLMYRYRRLPQARTYARENGYAGSMFPWQSSISGTEETQVVHLNPLSGKWGPDNSRIQRHVSFAIAYNVWKYWRGTGDTDFLNRYGAELFLSVAQFGASLASYNPRDKHYHIDGVMGPDEFHEKLPDAQRPGFRDNTYTNLLVAWTLHTAQEIIPELSIWQRVRILNKLGITQKELDRWDDIARRMHIIINPDGIISQFSGYLKLKELDWGAYRKKYGNIQRMDRILKAEGKSPDHYKVAKQADALMMSYLFSLSEIAELFRLLGLGWDKKILRKNYDYYIARTSHGSTLSKVVHCYIAHVLGNKKEAWDWFSEVLKSDIYDTQGGTTPEGIHAGVMGGSIDIVMRGFAGIGITGGKVTICPRLPDQWNSLRLVFLYQGSQISLYITKKHIEIFIHGPKDKPFDTPLEICGVKRQLLKGRRYTVPLPR
ncbi:MAG: glycoside hydrolase family 65 protein [Candidatus Omnitrophica bacterium]|nr:glycoside hydrolase family 65 protein [Candidatus Omnitrophota bacterium]